MARRKMLVADLLCGAGGSSTGAARALASLGLEMELVCVNHWPTAIETHKKNHPKARHHCQDISTVRPHIIVPEGYLDLLMASPTCTHHSAARGGKPTSDQQRSDPWHIITWLTELRVKRMLIENVPEFVSWGPVDPRTKRPIKSRKGEYFQAWTDAIRRLGFEIEWRILNEADYGDATTRRRFFLEARSDGKRLMWPAATHFKRRDDHTVSLFPTAGKTWRPAREIIDWNLKGKSIFTRKKSLSAKTLARIYAGAVKFKWPEPFLVILRNHMDAQSVDGPLPTVAANGTHIGIAQPILLANRNNNAAKNPGESLMPCATTAPGGGIMVVEPIVLSQHNSGAPRAAGEPLPTITTGGAAAPDHPGCARPMLVEPVILNGRKGNKAQGVSTSPVPTLDTKGGVWLAEPVVNGDWNCAACGEGNAQTWWPTCEWCGHEHPATPEPFLLSRHAGGAPRSTEEPTPTQVAKQSHVLIAPYYSNGSGQTCSSAEEPLPTPTTKARFGMVMPVTHGDGGNRARDVDTEGLPTITCAKRGELAFVTAQFGEREGQAPRVHDLGQPAPTIAATGHINLVEPAEGYDILFRMLEPHELAAAMGFSDEETEYEFVGTKTDKIKQIGNAVPVNTACALVKAVMSDAAAPQSKPAKRRVA